MSTKHPELVPCPICNGRHASDMHCRLFFCAICRCPFPRWDLHILTQEHMGNCETYAYATKQAQEKEES